LIEDHLAFLRKMRKSARKDDGMFIQKYATARYNAFQVGFITPTLADNVTNNKI
jgi:hypothetical protein